MKQIILLAILGICLVGCTNSAEKLEKANLAIAAKYMHAVETKNVRVMDSLLADTYVGYGPSINDSINKEFALINYRYLAENLYESIQYSRHKELAVTVKEGETMGDWVLNWAYLTIKYKDGRGPVHVWLNAVYKIKDGKIIQSRTFYNEADVLRQLGYTMVEPQIIMK